MMKLHKSPPPHYHMDHKRKKSGETSIAKCYDFQANTVNFGIIQS